MTDLKTFEHPPLTAEQKNRIAEDFMSRISREAFPGDVACSDCVTDIFLMMLSKYRFQVLQMQGPLTKTRINAEVAHTVLNYQMMFLAATESQIEKAPHLSQVN
tara:strand:+ start:1734 stop:2045 length:312 start_codon:yes stop_codon:yes gene_type:complete